jgi:sulfur dioxygenase
MTPIQIFDEISSTYTYLIFDARTREAIIIDPVDHHVERDLNLAKAHGLQLRYIVETHAHADHITSAGELIEHTGAQAATPRGCGIKPAAIQLDEGSSLIFGAETLIAIHTPGHTAGSMCYLWRNHVFTGDTLLIGGCGRTDFQSGSSTDLYQSISHRLFSLPDATIVWPAHDYKGQTSSTIGREKIGNARMNDISVDPPKRRSEQEFALVMANLNLPRPTRMDEAVPANLTLGIRHEADNEHLGSWQPAADSGYAGNLSPQLAHQWANEGKAVIVDIRSNAERSWVGFLPGVATVEWKSWPSMEANPHFDDQLRSAVPMGTAIMMLCRSGVRSIPSAKRAQSLGYQAFNILEGFEGAADVEGHRGKINGWRYRGLPWRQN